MKKFLVVLIVLCATSVAYSQISFGVSTDMLLKGSTIGYKFNNFVPYIGLQYYNASLTGEFTGKEYDYETQSIVDVNEKSEFSGSIFLASIGAKYLFNVESKNVKPFVNVAVFKPIISGSLKINGEEIDEFKDMIEKTSSLGFEFGIGAEYYFDKNFSVGGEFGFRMLMASNESTFEDYIYDPDTSTDIYYDATTKLDLGLGMTYTRINLNYYFDF
jgi:hypothetical protein